MLILAVLAPFAGLVAVGFWLLAPPPAGVISQPQPPLALPAPLTPPPTPAVAPAPPPPTLPLPAVTQLVSGPPEEGDDSLEEAVDALGRKPGLAGVDRLVRQCFDDARERVHTPQRVTVTYETTDAGRFRNVVIKRSTWPDPQMGACVLDAFEESQFEAPGRALPRRAETFTFSPAGAGR